MQKLAYLASLFRRRKRGSGKHRKSIKKRRSERALLFWTIRESLALGRQTLRFLFLAALLTYAIVSMIEGTLPDIQSIFYGR
jgi:hypothetical protein